MDEPTNGVDPISRREFWELLYRLADQKILIIVTTAYMDEAERCSEVHLIEQGRVIAEGDPRSLSGRPRRTSSARVTTGGDREAADSVPDHR